ncbi:hypothetical protein [Telmatospirillum sp. J64-1]|uniref:hypothetical protein n=1 Tax=Telmatospirillum sp. J64-1 TaxID=2502183 RepID=UPI00115C6091|nr:hypothetical protein [Telmatospirillum sp. J64-1]
MPDPVPCREQILTAVVDACQRAASDVPGLVVERERDQPVVSDEMPRVVVFEGAEDSFADFTGEDGFILDVDLEIYVTACSQAAALQKAGLLRAALIRRVIPDLAGGLARNCTLSPEPAPQRGSWDSAAPVAGIVLSFKVEYATAENDPFTFA